MPFIRNQMGCQNRTSQYKSLPRIPSRWTYATIDSVIEVGSVGYFNEAYQLGMRKGDEVAIGCKNTSGEDFNYIGRITETVVGEETHFLLLPNDNSLFIPLADEISFATNNVIDTGISIDTFPSGEYVYNILILINYSGQTYIVDFDAKRKFIEFYLDDRVIKHVEPIQGGTADFTVEMWVDSTTRTIMFETEDDSAVFDGGVYTVYVTLV